MSAKKSKTLSKKILQKKILYIYIADLILAILFALSFVKTCKNDKRETIKTALVNPKYQTAISKIEIYQGDRDKQDQDKNLDQSKDQGNSNFISLEKKGAYWTISQKNSPYSLPADGQRVENFILELIKVRNMYKLSDKIEKNSAFGLTDQSTFHIRYYYDDDKNENFHELSFGNQDFSLTGRYLMTDSKATVYEINSDFDSFLTTSVQNWSEPFIISQQVLGTIKDSDIQNQNISDKAKLLELRHGGLATEKSQENQGEAGQAISQALEGNTQTVESSVQKSPSNPDFSLVIQLGNKSSIQLDIFKTQSDTEFTVRTIYTRPDKSQATYYSKISNWTYNKIKEITL